LWYLSCPVWLKHGSLLVVVGLTQGSAEYQGERLYQVSIPTARFQAVSGPGIVRNSVSETHAGDTIAAVRLVRASSLWVADAKHLSTISQYTTGTDNIESLSWSKDSDIVFPSMRSGSMKLWRADARHYVPLGTSGNCVERQPVAVPNSSFVVYSS